MKKFYNAIEEKQQFLFEIIAFIFLTTDIFINLLHKNYAITTFSALDILCIYMTFLDIKKTFDILNFDKYKNKVYEVKESELKSYNKIIHRNNIKNFKDRIKKNNEGIYYLDPYKLDDFYTANKNDSNIIKFSTLTRKGKLKCI